jgi:hypothetical protein
MFCHGVSQNLHVIRGQLQAFAVEISAKMASAQGSSQLEASNAKL